MIENEITSLRETVENIYNKLRAAECNIQHNIQSVHANQRRSCANLIYYLALRCNDLRNLQDHLHNAGLSSLSSAESHILRQIQLVLMHLGRKFKKKDISSLDFTTGSGLIKRHAAALFGRGAGDAIPYLMVTLESELADNYRKVKALLDAGMNIARINCAHDSPEEWAKMIANIKKAMRATGKSCQIYMDLAGPKIRTVILGKGRKKGRMKIKEQEVFFLAEATIASNKNEKILGCTLEGVITDLREGHRVLFDDGLFEARVEWVKENIAQLRMIRISAKKPRIKPEKGINFPDTPLTVRCLTEQDKQMLPFVTVHADLIGFSFVRTPADVQELQTLLQFYQKEIPIILKIETLEAVQRLPSLLIQGMAKNAFGVMIARGDLAVEIGFERLSEVQEEILWLCEAGHVPVIWATQVLENMNKSGIATRAELTDAARAVQAECVMLNKGKYLVPVLSLLKGILARSGGHHVKKRHVFRTLNIAEQYFTGTGQTPE